MGTPAVSPPLNSRAKGACGEREFANEMNGHLGAPHFRRNLVQSRQGGADFETVGGCAVEVKRREKASWGPWVRQAAEQATAAGATPVLAWRANKQPWQIWVQMTPQEFAEWLRTARGVFDQQAELDRFSKAHEKPAVGDQAQGDDRQRLFRAGPL